jgi:hypothetical protein
VREIAESIQGGTEFNQYQNAKRYKTIHDRLQGKARRAMTEKIYVFVWLSWSFVLKRNDVHAATLHIVRLQSGIQTIRGRHSGCIGLHRR